MKLELSVKGMTCGGCEMHVEKAVREIKGLTETKASHAYGKLTVETDENWPEESESIILSKIAQKISDAGYTYDGKYKKSPVRADKKSHDSFSIKQWIGIIIIMAALFLVVRETGIINRLPVLENTMGYGLLFIIGLMTSVHCVGMCGGINLTVSVSGVRRGNQEGSAFKRTIPAILYNTGRVTSYTLIGGLVGALGSVITVTGSTQGIIVGIVGVFMVLMGIRMLGLFPWIDKIIPKMPKGLVSGIQNTTSGKGPFIVGLINGFMPCGPLQSVQIYALGTGSALSGALSMFLFSLGTVPLMLGFGSITSILPSRFHGKIMKVSALLVLLLGSGMVIRGMSLSGVSLLGISSYNSGSENVRIAEISGSKQFVKTIMHGDEYEPFIVQAGIPVVWTIYVEEEDLNGCNNPLTVPEYGIRYNMIPGENTIEFTPPDKKGTIIYTCWMGMITSGIKVVGDLNTVDASILGDTASLSGSSEGCSTGGDSSGGCCSGGFEGADASNISPVELPAIKTDNIVSARVEDNQQFIEVTVNENGFEPAVIVMQSGLETIWQLNCESLDEKNYRISFPAYGNQGMELGNGINSIRFIPEFDFTYYSWKKDFGGFVKIVDDISSIDIEEIRNTVVELNNSY